MKNLSVLLLTAGLLTGCASHGNREAMTSGVIGCPPSDVKITNGDLGWQTNTWTATCRGRVFYCTHSDASPFTCAPEIPAKQ